MAIKGGIKIKIPYRLLYDMYQIPDEFMLSIWKIAMKGFIDLRADFHEGMTRFFDPSLFIEWSIVTYDTICWHIPLLSNSTGSFLRNWRIIYKITSSFLCWQGGCASSTEYLGYDMTLALCICRVDDLQDTCDLECRLKQRNRIEMVCDDPPYIRVNYPNSDKVCVFIPLHCLYIHVFLCMVCVCGGCV